MELGFMMKFGGYIFLHTYTHTLFKCSDRVVWHLIFYLLSLCFGRQSTFATLFTKVPALEFTFFVYHCGEQRIDVGPASVPSSYWNSYVMY